MSLLSEALKDADRDLRIAQTQTATGSRLEMVVAEAQVNVGDALLELENPHLGAEPTPSQQAQRVVEQRGPLEAPTNDPEGS